MKIGLDVRFLDEPQPSGVEVFGLGVLWGLARVDAHHEFTLYGAAPELRAPFALGTRFRYRRVPEGICRSQYCWAQFQLPPGVRDDGIDVMLFAAHRTFMHSRPCPSLSTIFDLGFRLFPDSFPRLTALKFRILTQACARRSARLLAISESTKRDLMRLYGVPPDRIDVIYCGLDVREANPTVADAGALLAEVGVTEPYFLHVGVLQPRKNIGGLLDAFAEFKRRRPGKEMLVLVGKSGWKVTDLEARLRDDPACRAHVRWIGYADQALKWRLYERARCLVFPSLYEGFGIPALEAMSKGTPVLYADRSSLPEVVADAGLPFDPENREQMVEAMIRIADDDALRDALSRRGRERAELFSWERTASAILASVAAVHADHRRKSSQ